MSSMEVLIEFFASKWSWIFGILLQLGYAFLVFEPSFRAIQPKGMFPFHLTSSAEWRHAYYVKKRLHCIVEKSGLSVFLESGRTGTPFPILTFTNWSALVCTSSKLSIAPEKLSP
uniref:Secreted protein n=1 Tax=Panagrellus redivivus TaxID=6233 RepID=A0A7E4WBN3_PANRE